MKTTKTENVDLEKAILYVVFKHGKDALKQVLKYVNYTHLANQIHQKILYNLEMVYQQTNTVLSIQGFYKHALGTKDFEEQEKPILKTALKEIAESTLTLNDIEPSCIQLRQHFVTRCLHKTMIQKVRELKDKDINDVLYAFEKDIFDLRKQLNLDLAKNIGYLKKDIDKREKEMIDRNNNPTKVGYVKTGIDNFDKYMSPIAPGSLCLYQAKSNVGKSMLLMRTALKNYQNNVKTIVITIEMNSHEYAQRMDSSVSGIRHDDFTSGKLVADASKVSQWKNSILNYGKQTDDLIIYYVPENCTCAVVDLILENNPFKPDLVIVDYAGDMKASLKGISDYDFKAQSEIFSRLKEMAGKHQCVVFSAQQAQRGIKKLSAETGSLTKVATDKADLVITIEVDDDELVEDVAGHGIATTRYKLAMVKNRNGAKLKTYFLPFFDKMFLYEKEQDGPLLYGGNYEAPKDKKDKKNEVKSEGKKEEKAQETPKQEESASIELIDDLMSPSV
jgi:replicative DNA helicase